MFWKKRVVFSKKDLYDFAIGTLYHEYDWVPNKWQIEDFN